jgi:hypothetical protein
MWWRRSKNTEEMIELQIGELKNIDRLVNYSYDRMKLKALTFLGAGLAVLSFLYAGSNAVGIPTDVANWMACIVGIGLIVTSLVLFIITIWPASWAYPTTLIELEKFHFGNKRELLKYIKKEYIETIRQNTAIYEGKQRLCNIGFFMLIIGATILIVLKHFGGHIL